MVNRVGDFGFALGIFLVFVLTGSVSFDTIFAAAPGSAARHPHVRRRLRRLDHHVSSAVHGRLRQVGAVPGMVARRDGRPDPRSALIHAATMVTAGVFMVARLSPLFEQAPAA